MLNRRRCRYFFGRGGCRSGRHCTFAHDSLSGTRSSSPQSQTNDEFEPNSQAPPGVCRFYWRTGSCRFRVDCHFRHVCTESVTGESEGIVSGSGSTNLLPSTAGIEPRPDSQAPPGICRFYWRTGSCRFEFNCRYRHMTSEAQAEVDKPVRAWSPSPMSMSIDFRVIAPFLTDAGLTKMSCLGTDVFWSSVDRKLNPQMTQYYLSHFLSDGYHFRSVEQVYSFVTLLKNASSENDTWVSIIFLFSQRNGD